MDKGNLIVSTEEQGKKKGTMALGIFCFLMAMVMLWAGMSGISEDENAMMAVICFAGAAAMIYAAVASIWQMGSYAMVYENCVEIRTKGGLGKPPEDVRFKYADITNVSVSQNTITIFTAYAKYQVFVQPAKAPERELAVSAIRKRMGTDGGEKEADEFISEASVAENKAAIKKQTRNLWIAEGIIIVVSIMIFFFFLPR